VLGGGLEGLEIVWFLGVVAGVLWASEDVEVVWFVVFNGVVGVFWLVSG
jgi:hypothetical protein